MPPRTVLTQITRVTSEPPAGTDVAIEAADITLMSGALHGVVTAVALSKATMRNIRQNVFFAVVYNGVGIPIAAGALYPVLGWRLSPMLAAAPWSGGNDGEPTHSPHHVPSLAPYGGGARASCPPRSFLVTDHCVGPVGLHRVEVNIRPENGASLRVVQKLGFREEGTRSAFLHIAGAWRDHRSFALTADEVPDGLLSRWQAGSRS